MERSLLSEMTQKGLDAYVQQSIFLNMLYPQFFPLRQTPKLTWENVRGSSGAKIMADVIAYNSSAPQKTREIITKASGDIPKIAVKRAMNERDYNDYLQLKALAAPSQQAVLDLVYGDVDFVFNSVNARCEYLALQALSKGSLTLDSTNNNGLVTETAVDFGIPAANKTGVVDEWSGITTSTPIADIQAKVATATANGHTLKYIIMRIEEFNNMVKSTELKDLYGYYTGMKGAAKIAPSLSGLNDFLTSQMLPTILVINQKLRFENGLHVRSVVDPWNAGYITFIPDYVIGELQYGPIAEEAAAMPNVLRSKRNHVLVSKWSDMEPFNEWTKATANAFPVISDPESIYISNVERVSTFS